MLKKMFPRHEAGRRAPASGSLAATSQELQRILAVRWWWWRKSFLEAKRLQCRERKQEG